MGEDNLPCNQGQRVSSHPVAFHSLKDLPDFRCRDAALPHNGDRPCEKSTARLSQKDYKKTNDKKVVEMF